jgi:hypothetical protein
MRVSHSRYACQATPGFHTSGYSPTSVHFCMGCVGSWFPVVLFIIRCVSEKWKVE